MSQGIEQKLNYSFKNRELLSEALTHSSCRKKISYERLEFLGDRVLGLSIARLLFETFPDENEGDLAKRHAVLVQRDTLAVIAQDISLGNFITLSQSEEGTGGRKKDAILADIVESLFGAIYLDSSFDECDKVIARLFANVLTTHKEPPQDSKTRLQEIIQAEGKELPIYEVSAQTGPSHAPTFEITVHVKGYPSQRASATSKRAAEKKAAELLINEIQKSK